MKKLIILVLLLAIASITVSATMWKTVTLPFKIPTDVNALLVLEDSYIAFGDSGQALKAYFNSETIEYLPLDTTLRRNSRNAYKTANGRLVVVGDKNLAVISADSGRTWDQIRITSTGDIKSFIEQGNTWFFIPNRANPRIINSRTFYSYTVLGSIESEAPYVVNQEISIINGVNTTQGVVFARSLSTQSPPESRSDVFFLQNDDYRFTLIKSETTAGDSILSMLGKDDVARMISINKASNSGFYYESNKTDYTIARSTSCSTLIGDDFIPYGYVYPDGRGYFLGNDKDGKIIMLDLSGNRNVLDYTTKITCLNGLGEKLLVGGKNGQILEIDYPTNIPNLLREERVSLLTMRDRISLITKSDEPISWKLISLLGSTVLSGTEKEIRTNNLKGMYLIEIVLEHSRETKKVIL